jgi:4-carboxymuconolactone decarboxylase
MAETKPAKKLAKKLAKKPTKRRTKKSFKRPFNKPVKKQPKPLPYRLPDLTEDKLDDTQRALLSSMRAGPRGDRIRLGGPFGVYMHAPQYGDLTQQLGAFVRFKTSLPPRLSEFAILCTARLWRAQYEWHAHAPIAEKAGVKAGVIADLKAGRRPSKAATDERAIFDFVRELYKQRRVSDRTYKRVQGFLGDKGTVELTGILGYYASVSMTLNVFNVGLPDGAASYFPEPKQVRSGPT